MNNHQLNRRRKREEERARELAALPAGAPVDFRTDAGVLVTTRIKQQPWQLLRVSPVREAVGV